MDHRIEYNTENIRKERKTKHFKKFTLGVDNNRWHLN